MNFDLAQHRYLNTYMLVQSSSILELVEITMSVFNSQEVCTFLSWVTCSNTHNHTGEHLAMPLYCAPTRVHAYLDTATCISV